jgi:hypothetical protein
VITVWASGKILPFPMGISVVLTLTGPPAPLDPPEATPEVAAGWLSGAVAELVQELRPAMAAAASPVLMITVRREIGSESVVRSVGIHGCSVWFGETRNDHAIKNDNTPVTQRAVTLVSTSPPASGSAHFGESSRVKINILKTKAPYKKQPNSECAITRPS